MIDSSQLEIRDLQENEFPQTWSVLKKGVQDEVAPGFVAGFWRKKNPQEIWVGSIGNRRLIPSSLPMEKDTIFDLASVAKVFATAPLAAALIERGWLNWNTSLSALFRDYPYPKIQIRHLLSHTAGFVAWVPFWEKLKDNFAPRPVYEVSIKKRQAEMRKLVLSIVPDAKPGEKAVYSDISFLLLGFALEEVTQMTLDQAVKRFVWKPMGIQGAYYQSVTSSANEYRNIKVAATEDSLWRGGVLQGQVHDDNCWAMGGYGGHAGVFGTARDVLHFARGLMMGFFSPAVLEPFWARVKNPPDCSRTLGWDMPSGETPSAGKLFSKDSVGHLGFTGTSLWIDRDAELAVVLLSNRVHPTRENIKIRDFRPRFHEAIRLDLKC